MWERERLRAAIIRAGTSKGVFLMAEDLPEDPDARDKIILAIFGSPDPRQIDGLGGADPLTSKVAIVARSARAGIDVDYTVGYVAIDEAVVDYAGNCGNISQGVGPFAVDEGLVPATEPFTRVRIFNTNTNTVLEAEVPVREGKAVVEGDFIVEGVPGSGARILTTFVDSAGSKTGKLLPTGNVTDRMTLQDGRTIEVSLVDAAVPAIFARAADVRLTGHELPRDTDTNPAVLAVMEEIRVKGAIMMGLAATPDEAGPAVPKVAIVSPPHGYRTMTGETVGACQCDLVARTKALSVMHKAFAVTGGLCLSTAALIEGSVVNDVVRPAATRSGLVRVGHPSGVSSFAIAVRKLPSGGFELTRAAVAGTARRLMDGYVYVSMKVRGQ